METQIDLPPPPFGLEWAPIGESTADAVAAADITARHWRFEEKGTLPPGSEAHRRAVARMFRETFNPYKPSVIDWPKLDAQARQRLVSLPIWDVAVQTEGKARLRMLSYARHAPDPLWSAAIELNGWEEGRHKQVLSNLVAAYGIAIGPEPCYIEPRDAEWGYLLIGFSECIDSFFAFGLFELARRSGFFPQELVDTFEPVMQEECRHILLFANWVSAHRRTMPLWRRPWFELRVWAVWAVLARDRIGMVRDVDSAGNAVEQDYNFTLNGSAAVSDVDVDLADLMALCLSENDRRFAGYDQRLRRPTTMPFVARTIVGVMRLWRTRVRRQQWSET